MVKFVFNLVLSGLFFKAVFICKTVENTMEFLLAKKFQHLDSNTCVLFNILVFDTKDL